MRGRLTRKASQAAWIGLVIGHLAVPAHAAELAVVEGPVAFAEARAVVDVRLSETYGKTRPVGEYFDVTSNAAVALQSRATLGWSLRGGAHRVLLGVNWRPSWLVFHEDGRLPPIATAGLIEPSVAAVVVTPQGVFRPRPSLPIRLESPWFSALEANVQVRRTLSEQLLMGLEVQGFVSLVQPSAAYPYPKVPRLRCAFPDRRCGQTLLTRWSAEMAMRAEWWFHRDWSLAGALSMGLIRELLPVGVGAGSPDSLVYWPEWIAGKADFDTVVSWTPTRFFGFSLMVGVSGRVRNDGVYQRSFTAALSFWFRADPRLQRNWIDL